MEHERQSPSTPAYADGAQSIRRALDIARHVAQLQRSGATLARISKATGLNRSTAFRILRSLTDGRLLHFRQHDRTYHIGPLAFELGLAGSAYSGISEEWHDVVSMIAARTGLTSYLMARSGDEAVCMVCVQGTTSVRAVPVEVGQRVPLGIGAGGLALLAAMDDGEVRRIATENAARLDVFPAKGLSVDAMEQRVCETRRLGFSVSRGTVAHGVVGVGVLVPRQAGLLQLALTVSAASLHIDVDEAEKLADIICASLPHGNL